MSGGLVQENTGSNETLGNFGKNKLGNWLLPSRRERMIEASTHAQITRKGNWCLHDKNRYCQEARCCDCAAAHKE